VFDNPVYDTLIVARFEHQINVSFAQGLTGDTDRLFEALRHV